MSGSKLPLARALSDFAVEVAKVRAIGDAKYGTGTWAGLEPREFLDAAARHLSEMAEGRLLDNESGLSHAAHVAVNMEYLWATTRAATDGPPIEVSLRAREVYRWHTVPVVRPQSLADHSYAVACVARRLLQILGRPDMVPVAVAAALDHDIAEVVQGDVPAPAKGASGGFGRYWSASDPLWRRALRVADKLEAYTYVRSFGVGRMAAIAERQYRDWIDRIPVVPGEPNLYAAAAQVLAEAARNPPTAVTDEEAARWERK